MLKRLGYFVTESSEHFAEYTPYFIKPRPDLIEKLNPWMNIRAGAAQMAEWEAQAGMTSSGALTCEKSVEYAARIIARLCWKSR